MVEYADGATLAQEYGASVAGLRTGDMLSLHNDSLYALLLPSGDDAAVAIADGIAGSQAGFVALMNIEASLLGLRNTHYTDVHGLEMPGLHTSARDLARLATLAMRNKTFAQIVQTTAYTVPATSTHGKYAWSTTNNLLITTDPDYYPGAIGIKTGFTGEAGGCLVFAARGPSGELLGVLLGEAVENNRFSDALALLTGDLVSSSSHNRLIICRPRPLRRSHRSAARRLRPGAAGRTWRRSLTTDDTRSQATWRKERHDDGTRGNDHRTVQ